MFTFLYTCFSLFWSTPTDIFWDPTFGFHLTACGPAFFVVFQDCGLPSVESADELLTEAELLRPPPPISSEPGPCNSSQIPLRAWVCFSGAVEHAHSSLTLPWTLHCHLPPSINSQQ